MLFILDPGWDLNAPLEGLGLWLFGKVIVGICLAVEIPCLFHSYLGIVHLPLLMKFSFVLHPCVFTTLCQHQNRPCILSITPLICQVVL